MAAALLELFQVLGHAVRYAEDGLSALAAVRQRMPDVICLDVDMPKMTGPEVSYRLIVEDAGKEEIPIVLISGVADLVQVARRVGTPYHVGKPFVLDTLLRTVERALTERCAPHPAAAAPEGGMVEPRR